MSRSGRGAARAWPTHGRRPSDCADLAAAGPPARRASGRPTGPPVAGAGASGAHPCAPNRRPLTTDPLTTDPLTTDPPTTGAPDPRLENNVLTAEYQVF